MFQPLHSQTQSFYQYQSQSSFHFQSQSYQSQPCPPQAQLCPPQSQLCPPQSQPCPPQSQLCPPQSQPCPPQSQLCYPCTSAFYQPQTEFSPEAVAEFMKQHQELTAAMKRAIFAQDQDQEDVLMEDVPMEEDDLLDEEDDLLDEEDDLLEEEEIPLKDPAGMYLTPEGKVAEESYMPEDECVRYLMNGAQEMYLWEVREVKVVKTRTIWGRMVNHQ